MSTTVGHQSSQSGGADRAKQQQGGADSGRLLAEPAALKREYFKSKTEMTSLLMVKVCH